MRVIGTGGSTDYLRDGAGAKRYWPARLHVADDVVESLDAESAQVIGRLCQLSGEIPVLPAAVGSDDDNKIDSEEID